MHTHVHTYIRCVNVRIYVYVNMYVCMYPFMHACVQVERCGLRSKRLIASVIYYSAPTPPTEASSEGRTG